MNARESNGRYITVTATGVRLNLDDPRPENIKIEDVAGGLSKVCRFAAQVREYYSVAQHALLVRRLVVEAEYPELALAALHHDSHEAYLCDIPSPLKKKISATTKVYDEACDTLDHAIAEAFGFKVPEEGSQEEAVIKHADRQALLIEAMRLLPDRGEALRQDLDLGENEFRALAALDDPLPPAGAEAEFLRAHTELVQHALR